MNKRSIGLLCQNGYRTQKVAIKAGLSSPATSSRLRSTFSSANTDGPASVASEQHGPFRRRVGRRGSKFIFRGPDQTFDKILDRAFEEVRGPMKKAPIVEYMTREGLPFAKTWSAYREASLKGGESADNFDRMRAAYDAGLDAKGVQTAVRQGFYAYVTRLRFTELDVQNQKDVADLRYPAEWFPITRRLQRKIHLHVGPTNSGKTFHALKSLEAANSGMYAGPLRLLAHEVYTRLNAKGKPCALITGEEQRFPAGRGQHNTVACTVEMISTSHQFEVAVIDEIQMLGDPSRGWAWTQGLLGVQAHEVHLCGEPRAVPLVQRICAALGEEVIIHKYERLSPLKMDQKSLQGDLTKLRKGDCIVSFSVRDIHPLRKEIEKATGRKVATVYGSLPPETRAQQAQLFNDPDNDYDFLVASDAIGMGLNLSIKRIIFETTVKYDGTEFVTLDVSSLKQIAGRAGRYKSAHTAIVDAQSTINSSVAASEAGSALDIVPAQEVPDATSFDYQPRKRQSQYELAMLADNPNVDLTKPIRPPPNDPTNFGLVTTLEAIDYSYVSKAIKEEGEPIDSAYLDFPPHIIARFAQSFPPGTPFSYIMMRLAELTKIGGCYRLSTRRDFLWIADLIEPVRNLSVGDRIIFCTAPASLRDVDLLWRDLLPEMATCVEQQSSGALYDLQAVPLDLLDQDFAADYDFLRRLELLHKALVAYLWLSYRFAGIFTTRPLALQVKQEVEGRIGRVLEGLDFREQEKWRVRVQGRKKGSLRREAKDLAEASPVAPSSSSEPTDEVVDAATEEPLVDNESHVDDLAEVIVEDNIGDRVDSSHAQVADGTASGR